MILYLVSNPFTGKMERFKSLDEAKSKYIDLCENIILTNGPKISTAINLDPENVNNNDLQAIAGKEPLQDITQKSFYKWLNVSLEEFSADVLAESTEKHLLSEEIAFYDNLEKEKLQIYIEERTDYLQYVQANDVAYEHLGYTDRLAEIASVESELLSAKQRLENTIQNKNLVLAFMDPNPNVIITAAEVKNVDAV